MTYALKLQINHTVNVYISRLWLEEISPTVNLKIKKPIADL